VLATAQANHYCKVEIDGTSLTLTALTPTGEVIDSFTRSAPSGVTSPGEGAPAPGIILHPAYPNPLNGTTTIEFTAPSPTTGTLSVYNVAGIKVRTLAEGQFAARTHKVAWDGTDDQGRAVESGVYFTRLTAGKTVRTGRVKLVKSGGPQNPLPTSSTASGPDMGTPGTSW